MLASAKQSMAATRQARGDIDAGSETHFDQPIQLKGDDRLADGGPGDGVGLGKVALRGQPPADGEVAVEAVTHGQQWAVEVLVDAGLTLHTVGAVFVKGDVGPMTPYLPSGAFL